MNAETFIYWLQGALEMNPEMLEKGMTPEQVQTIQDHLDLVLNKVTPDRFNKEPNLFDIEGLQPLNRTGETGFDPTDGMPKLFCATVNECTAENDWDLKKTLEFMSKC